MQARHRFAWDETPKQIFDGDPNLGFVRHIRLAERQLTSFLREWRGTADTHTGREAVLVAERRR
jgi:hypothetical protein